MKRAAGLPHALLTAAFCACSGAPVRPPAARAVPPPSPAHPVAVVAGAYHTCARLDDGSAWCWGSDAVGQIGLPAGGDQPTPARVPGIGRLRSVRTASWQTCLTDTASREHCFGVPPEESDPSRPPGHGWRHACEVVDYRVLCRGDGSFGQLGDGTTESHEDARAIPGIEDAIDVASGNTHSCALRVGGEVLCWGDNTFGQLGDGSRARRTEPTHVALP